MYHLENKSSVRFSTTLSPVLVKPGHYYNLFAGIANAISGKSVKLYEIIDGLRYVCSWDIENFSCKFYTKNKDDDSKEFFMRIVNHSEQSDELDSDADTDGDTESELGTIFQNIHDRLTRLESSFPHTRPCQRQLQ